MAHRNLLQSGVLYFAKLAMRHGWTEEETRGVITAVQDEVNREAASGHSCQLESILKKHAMPVIERKKKEKENKTEKI